MSKERTPSIPPQAASVAFLLSKVGRTQAQRFTDRLGPLGLRPRHFLLLNNVALNEGSSQQQLGDRLALDPSGLVAVIDDLEGAGLVERRHDPADRRRYAIHLTPTGRRRLERARQVAMERERELLAPLSQREQELLHDLLLRIAAVDDPSFGPEVPAEPVPASTAVSKPR